MYYAIEYAYGAHVVNNNGGRVDTVHAFKSRATRDAWIDKGMPYMTSPGYREPLLAREVRTVGQDIVLHNE
jgi:hypothetical protein